MGRATPPESQVRALWRQVAGRLAIAALAGLLSVAGGLLLVSWLAAGSSYWQRPSVAPLMLWLLASVLAAAWLWRLATRAFGWTRAAAAAEIEESLNLPRGSLRGVLEPGLERPGTSRSLVELQRARLARGLEGRGLRELGGRAARSARSYAVAAAVIALSSFSAVAAIWAGERESAEQAWLAVVHPVRHLSMPPLPPLVLDAERQVRRGGDLPVTVGAPQRDSILLAWWARGAVVERRWQPVVAGRARAVVPRVEAPTLIWASAPDGAVSDTLQVEPVDPLLLIAVDVNLRFPPHTRREPEVLSGPSPVIPVPAGTRAIVTGVTTRAVARVALVDDSGHTIPFELTADRRFRASFTIASGSWGWDIAGSGGEVLEGEPDSLRFLAVPDSAPQVRITYPGVDTVMSLEMTQPLLVDVGDDYGLSRVELVSWRVSAWGERWPERADTLAQGDDRPRASLAGLIDARGRGFLPGDTLRYFVRAFDNAPQPQFGVSREYSLRLPSLDEVRERAVADARELVQQTERLAEQARAQQEATQELQRSTEVSQPPGAQPQPGSDASSVEFRETEEARRAVELAESLLDQSREIQESLRDLLESIERAGLNDESVLERLREIESLFERVLTPELQEKLEALREALAVLDPQLIRDAIRQLAEGSADFRERVERALELLRRAALEQEFATLETRAEELVEAQQQLADAVSEAQADRAAQLAAQAEQLGARADDLSQRIGELTAELERAQEEQAGARAEAAESAVDDASRADSRAATELARRSQRASAASQRALARMREAASQLRAGRQLMQEGWRQEVVAALRRAQAETLELARRQRALNETFRSTGSERNPAAVSDLVALRRAVQQIEDGLVDASESSLLVDPRLAQVAADIGAVMEELVGQLSDASRAERPDLRLGEDAGEGLSELAFRLMRASDQAGSAESGTGLQEALAQLAELAERQGALNQQAGGLTPGAVGVALLQELQRLAAQQRGIARELGQINRSVGPRGQVLGQLDQLEREAEDLARELERGRLDQEVVERQNQLFRRLLDAGRSLEQDEFERERRAERPGDVEVLRPGALPSETLRGRLYPHPGADVLSRYPPAIRRLILEYFDRLNQREGVGGS